MRRRSLASLFAIVLALAAYAPALGASDGEQPQDNDVRMVDAKVVEVNRRHISVIARSGVEHVIATDAAAQRVVVGRAPATDPMDDVKLSDRGELHVFSIVHQSAPGIPTPYIAAIVDLPEGVSVRCNIAGVEADPKNLTFGMPVQMVTEKIRTDREGNDVIAFSFKPA